MSSDARRISRRGLLAAALALGAAPARAEPPPRPVSKADAQYQAGPKGLFSCAVCTLFKPPRGCKVVDGDISPYGWCKYFDLPD